MEKLKHHSMLFIFRVPPKMSLPPEVSIPPFEFPLPRAINYDLLSPSQVVVYSICIVATVHKNGLYEEQEIKCGNYSYSSLFHEIEDRYSEYGAHGGFVFPKDSIALRLKSMNRVLCWFGFRDDIKYTCYVSKVGCSTDAVQE